MCGGSGYTRSLRSSINGLSPRVRGKRLVIAGHGIAGRSIPACAGEAATVAVGAFIITVYPRVCGGSHRGRFAGQ